jgi:predicted aspartyl protease
LGDEETSPVTFVFASAIPFVLFLSMQAQTMSAHVAMKEMSGVPIVQVSVNGTGPYPFVLDTGANVTVIKRRLLQKLQMPGIDSVTIAASLGDSAHQRTKSATLAIDGLSLEQIEINTLEDGQLGALEGHVEGILGENFLKHFDLLIDNDHHALTLDRTTSLEGSFEGEHLPVSRTGTYNSTLTPDRIVVRLQLAVLARPVFFLLDSGTNTLLLFPRKEEAAQVSWNSGRGNINPVRDDQPPGWIAALNLTSGTEKQLVATPDGAIDSASFSWDERWIILAKTLGRTRRQIMIAPVQEGVATKEDKWIAVTDGTHNDFGPQFSREGNVVYFISTRDGYGCIWAQRLDPVTRQPIGDAFGYEHFHDASQKSLDGYWGSDADLSVSRDKIIVSLVQWHVGVWMTQFE